MTIANRIRESGVIVPTLDVVPGAFAPFTVHNNIVVVSGQLPVRNGKSVFTGKVPDDVSLADAQAAARLCVANILGWLNVATHGNLEKVSQVLRLGGFVSTSQGFSDAPAVINAASHMINQIFAEKGTHARIAIGVASLPFNAPVEVEATFVLEPGDE
ncbi:RidA family protein [Pseudomonas typographi]|uniref:RidA family protein n=1 Tax=Pseudomonas typographi TaxID=2715964 RepID=A0ABR7Z5E8_9PSED|nr:RidA family protein [Pseudomonas typographi]MBD1554090.1 RidA family protein [Pseudomonas typographi]MBD1589338.1 RidA family protein [Pseudomonas typographi]MBD1600703.1 RidA family protein [Pseudomonas typographi]